MNKDELFKKINEIKLTTNRNKMGCSENWYNPAYAISQVFTKEELEKMTDKEIDNLYKLALALSDAFW